MVCDVKISDEKVVLTLGACVSLVCLFAVLFMYFGLDIPNLKRHSSTLIIRRCVFEIVFVSQYLWLGFVPHNFLWSEYNSNDDDSFDCETNPSIWPLAWLTQFSLLGAELWFAALAVDIHVSLTNPFSSHRVYDMYYRIFVYTFSGIMATILVSVMPIQYGVSTDPMIWVRDQAGQVNWTKIAMFYMFVPFIYSYGAVILVWARWQIHRGLEETLQMRKYSVSKLTRCKAYSVPSSLSLPPSPPRSPTDFSGCVDPTPLLFLAASFFYMGLPSCRCDWLLLLLCGTVLVPVRHLPQGGL